MAMPIAAYQPYNKLIYFLVPPFAFGTKDLEGNKLRVSPVGRGE